MGPKKQMPYDWEYCFVPNIRSNLHLVIFDLLIEKVEKFTKHWGLYLGFSGWRIFFVIWFQKQKQTAKQEEEQQQQHFLFLQKNLVLLLC